MADDETTYELALRKVAHFERTIELLRLDIANAQGMERDAMRQLKAWRTIAQGEAPTVEITATEPTGEDGDEPDGVYTVQQFVHPRTGVLHVDMDAYGSKTQAVRRLLGERGKFGVTPSEVNDYLASKKIKVSASFAGNALFKMKERGEIGQIGVRYVLSHLITDAVEGFGEFAAKEMEKEKEATKAAS